MANLVRVVCALLLFTAGTAHSQCLNLVAANANSRFEFLSAVIRSLADFKSAQETATNMADANSPTDLLIAMDVHGEKIKCASDRLDGFRSTKDKNVKSAVEAFQTTAGELSHLNSTSKDWIVKELNGDVSNKPGDRAARNAELAKQYRETWALLPLAAAVSFMAAVEFESPNTQKSGRLAITRQELEKLNASLESNFPGIATEWKQREVSQPEAAALVLYMALNKEGWPTHEQPFPSQTSPGT